ncbi:hypothetical protein VNO80_31634 [Phaseolus coccineus]|uniref:SAWADEE domain-containing protein n=1 Tax=Phaseolus coccineus TaxID=3886 RepID=A0AAN9L3V1_PHACN
MLTVTEKTSAVVPVSSYATEFKAYKDDAWYTVCVLFHGDTLTVKYFNFSPENDDSFRPSHFQNLNELENFKRRFRPLSKQLQDDECRLLSPGARVCACHSFAHDDVRFYDALVDGVQESKHSWETGEEECLCTFILFWLHGPNARNLTTTSIENICVVQPRWELDPILASFLDMVKQKIELFSSCPVLVSTGAYDLEMVTYGNKIPNTTRRMSCLDKRKKETQRARRSVVDACSPEVSCHDRRREDRDLEGTKNVYMILITNIDKELCPSTVTEFLRRHTSLSVSVFIFPSLSTEVYTRGAIMVHSEKEFQELCGFLNNPNCIITSSTGRPWVILEKLVGLKNIKASIGALVHISENILQEKEKGTRNNLKVVDSGSKEFKIASIMKDLFWAFSEHQERLQKRLAVEERRIFAANQQLS